MFRQLRKREQETDTQRIEAFSDGVFAVAITLLVLEIHVPHLKEEASAAQLRAALAALWPSYFAFAFSFVTVGIYWANHHFIFKIYQRTNHAFNLLNLLFLMCLTFLPLPTEVMGEYLLDDNKRQVAILFYNFGLFLPACAWSLMWFYASKNYRLIDRKLTPGYIRFLSRQYQLSNGLYIAAFLTALANAWCGLAFSVAQTAFYLLPPKPPIYEIAEKGAESEIEEPAAD